MTLLPHTQPPNPPSLHYLEQLAKQRAEHYLHVGNYGGAMRVATDLYLAHVAVKVGNKGRARELLIRACEPGR